MIQRDSRKWSVGALCVYALVAGGSALARDTPWHCASSAEVWGNPVAALQLAGEHPGVVLIEARGVVLQSRLGGRQPARPIAFFGPRLGWLAVDRSDLSGFTVEGVTSAPVQMRVHWRCEFLPDRLEWFLVANELAARVDPSAAFTGDLVEFERLAIETPGDFERAAALQLLAGAQYRVGRFTDAAAGFSEAAGILLRLGDRERAGAALLGVSDMRRLSSDLASSEQAARQALSLLTTPATAYFALRARENLCQVLHWRQQWEAADRCVSALPDAFLALGDLDGYVNAQTNGLTLRRDMGERIEVLAEQERLARVGSSPDVGPMRRGRWALTLAMALRDQGDAAAALRAFNEALRHFEAAPEERERWVANTLLQVAGLYADLGMYSQAYESHRQALKAMALSTAPGRVAAALTRFAEIDRQSGYRTRAAMWASQSAEIYRALAMPGELAGALLTSAELGMDAQPPLMPSSAVREQLARDLPAPLRPRWALLQARMDLASTGKFDVQWPDANSIPLAAQLEASGLAADASFNAGDPVLAAGRITDALSQVVSLAQQSANPVLGHLLLQSAKPLRARAARWLIENADPSPALASAVLSTHSLSTFRPTAGEKRSPGNIEFSANVARRLIYGVDTPGGSGERMLLSRLSEKAADTDEVARIDVVAVQSVLTPGDVLLMAVPGSPSSTLALISRDRALWRAGPGEEELGSVSRNLLTVLERRQGTWIDMGLALDNASVALLHPFAGEALPTRLFVLYEESVAMIPWAALRWPGQQEPLAQTTQVSWVTQITQVRADLSDGAHELHLFIANPQSRGGQLVLANLPNAEAEQVLIQKGQTNLVAHTLRNEQATADRLREALDASAGLVHIAAHGQQDTGLLGYSGLWLAPRPGTTEPQFLSWMDLADRPIRSGLVVLNACQLAAGPNRAGYGSMSFATAFSAAGADQVVAALWRVSDTAATVWVPSFYRALDVGDLASSAEALRQAQLALIRSRHFRHPYYWASLAHFRRLEVPVVTEL